MRNIPRLRELVGEKVVGGLHPCSFGELNPDCETFEESHEEILGWRGKSYVRVVSQSIIGGFRCCCGHLGDLGDRGNLQP